MTADIATSLKDWSATAASNQPDNSDPIGPNILAENQRTIQSVVRAALAGGDTIASATTTDIGAKDANYLAVSGTTTITGLGTVSAGIVKILKFDGILTFTHNGTSLILPTGANITTAAGDVAVVRSEGSGNWRCLWFQRKDGSPLVSGTPADGSITYAKIQDVSATSRVLGRKTSGAGDTEECTLSEVLDFIGSAAQGDILYRDASGWARLGAGTSGYFLKTLGAGANPAWAAQTTAGITLGTEAASTSGTAIDFTSIPAGTKRITIMPVGVSTNGTSNLLVQIGDSGGVETTSYTAQGFSFTNNGTTASTAGFILTSVMDAGAVFRGAITLTLENATANTWVISGTLVDGTRGHFFAGAKSLSATLDRVRITTVNGTDAFDAGAINIAYE